MILVTGGAGFIGSNLVAALRQDGQHVVVCDKMGEGDKWRNLSRHAVEDFVHPNELVEYLKNLKPNEVTSILHLGGLSSTTERDVDKLIHYNLRLSKSFWQAAVEIGVPFIYASSAATYGDGREGFSDLGSFNFLGRLRPKNPYGWSKHVFDLWVASQVEAGNPAPPQWAGLKFFNVYGPNEYHKGPQASPIFHFFNQISKFGLIRLFKSHEIGIDDGYQKRDFVWIGDCVNVIRWLLDNGSISGLFNVGTGDARTFLDVADSLFRTMNSDKKIEFIPTPPEIRESYQYFTQADIQKLRTSGYSKKFVSLEEGVKKYTLEYLKNRDPYL